MQPVFYLEWYLTFYKQSVLWGGLFLMKVVFKSESTLTELEPDNTGVRKEHDQRAVYSHEQTALLNIGYAV